MSWSHSLIRDTLEEFKAEVQLMTNLTVKTTFNALLDYHQEVLEDDDYEPFFMMGVNLPVRLGDKIKIKNLEAIAKSWDYQDSYYQIINLEFIPLFKVGDIVHDASTEQFLIKEVTKRFYRFTDLQGNGDYILPFIYQDVITKINS